MRQPPMLLVAGCDFVSSQSIIPFGCQLFRNLTCSILCSMSITDTSSLLRLSLPPVAHQHPLMSASSSRFDGTQQGSLVPYYSLNICLANFTPDVMYPVIRFPVHSVAEQTWDSAFDIVYFAYEASSLVHFRSTHYIHTCGNPCFHFSLIAHHRTP